MQGSASSAPIRQTDGVGPEPGQHGITGHRGHGTRTIPTGTRRTRPAVGCRTAGGGVSTQAWSTPSRLSRGTVTLRRVSLQLCEEPGCAGANLTGTKRGGAGAVERGSVVRLVVDLSCSTDCPRPIRLDISNWGLVSQTGMIEVVTMDRQYSPRKNFPIGMRNFRNSISRVASPGAAVGGRRRGAVVACGESGVPRTLGQGRPGVGTVRTSLPYGVKCRTGQPFDGVTYAVRRMGVRTISV